MRISDWSSDVCSSDLTADQRVDQVLAWLDQPAATRPRIVTLYFDMVDSAGHGHGPDSPQAHAALAEVDAAIGRLRAGLVERGLLDHANLMIVSDHGMPTVAPWHARTEEHTPEIQSLHRITSAV